jgi:Baseplate J-like protein
MQRVDEQPETIHLYVVREAAPKPSLLPIFLSVVALSILVAICVFSPYQQPVTRITLRVPAVLLPLQTFTAQVAVIPTGVKVYSATTAHGVLTITNGSVIAQTIPQGFRLDNVITDRTVFVPAGSANGYGVATVAAHALISGSSGNIPAYAVNQVVGSSIYIRNLSAFSGGHDAYTVMIVTPQDRQTAIDRARQELTYLSTGLHYPCNESISGAVTVVWRCQFMTYRLPAFYHVTGVEIIGKNLLLAVWFVARPGRIWVK